MPSGGLGTKKGTLTHGGFRVPDGPKDPPESHRIPPCTLPRRSGDGARRFDSQLWLSGDVFVRPRTSKIELSCTRELDFD